MPTAELAAARFIAGFMMHIAMMRELEQGLQKIKFSLNNAWRIEKRILAFMTGLLQTSVVVLVTLIGYIVIIVNSSTVIDVAKDFLTMMVIAEFDNYLYLEHSKDDVVNGLLVNRNTDNLRDLLKVQRTTSRECVIPDDPNSTKNAFEPMRSTIWVNEYRKADAEPDRPELEIPKSIRITFGDRPCCERFCFLGYRFLRLLHVSFWFYFSPLCFSLFQFILPLYVLWRDGELPVGEAED